MNIKEITSKSSTLAKRPEKIRYWPCAQPILFAESRKLMCNQHIVIMGMDYVSFLQGVYRVSLEAFIVIDSIVVMSWSMAEKGDPVGIVINWISRNT